MVDIEKLFEKIKLLPTIVQDTESGKILMLAYMNKESLRKTIETKKTWFWSRSRKRLWNKGETSGNFQIVREIYIDCDLDTLLVKVDQIGQSACHTGNETCFYEKLI